MKFLRGSLVATGLLVAVFVCNNTAMSADSLSLIAIIPSDTINGIFGRWIVPFGDQNDDGYDDFLVGNLYSSAYLYYGGDPPDTLYELKFDSVQASRMTNLGDVNGDGYDDLGMNGRGWYDWTYNIYFGGPDMDTVPDMRFGNFFHRFDGPAVITPDINFNGSRELFVRGFYDQSLDMFEIDFGQDTIPDLVIHAQWDKFVAGFAEVIMKGDFNGDDTVDIAVNFRPDPMDSVSGEIQFFYGGNSFDTLPDFKIRQAGAFERDHDRFGWFARNLGDVNGDGYDDIFAGQGNSIDSLDYIFYCGPALDSIPDVTFAQWFFLEYGTLGDINNDGYCDLIASQPTEAFNANKAWIFYGGQPMDASPDIIIGRPNLPQVVFIFANGIGGVGDVNGDGINDFAVSAKWAHNNQGQVYLYSGIDMSTDVDEGDDSPLPTDFHLEQNYPNPFNPETVIEYSIPTKSNVTINIINLLGQSVRTLVNETQSVGAYRVLWDGRSDAGKALASGVYFYTLKVDGSVVQSRKMVLLK